MDFNGILKEFIGTPTEFNRILKEFLAQPMDFNGFLEEKFLHNLWISMES